MHEYNTNIKINKSVRFIKMRIYYWQPYLLVLYGSILSSGECGGCGYHRYSLEYVYLMVGTNNERAYVVCLVRWLIYCGLEYL